MPPRNASPIAPSAVVRRAAGCHRRSLTPTAPTTLATCTTGAVTSYATVSDSLHHSMQRRRQRRQIGRALHIQPHAIALRLDLLLRRIRNHIASAS